MKKNKREQENNEQISKGLKTGLLFMDIIIIIFIIIGSVMIYLQYFSKGITVSRYGSINEISLSGWGMIGTAFLLLIFRLLIKKY